MYIYIYIERERGNRAELIGWSNNHFNKLHFRMSPETSNNYMFQTHEA